MKTTIIIENLKCGGCESTILNSLTVIKGVLSASVNQDDSSVDVEYADVAVLDQVKRKLKKIGYPEAGSVSGLSKTAANARSYVSCAIGKFSEKDHDKV